MREIPGWELVSETGELKSLPKGAYILRITKVVDVPEKEYLEVYSDIVDGEYKNYFATLESNTGKDYSRSFRSYKTSALSFFKAFITAVEKSNSGYQWNWDEKTLVGRIVVGVFGEEEYIKDGESKVMVKLQEFRSLEALRTNQIKIPELKKLPVEDRPVEKPMLEKTTSQDLPW